MERRVVRRVAVNNRPGNQWDGSWLGPVKRAFKQGVKQVTSTLDRHSATLIHRGGIAAIWGGIIWIVLISILQLQAYDIVPYDAFYSQLFYSRDIFEKLLIVPLVFFITTTLGMLALQRRSPKGLAYTGIFLVFVGLALTATLDIYEYRLYTSWSGIGTFAQSLLLPDALFFYYIIPNLFVLALGLIYFTLANTIARTFPLRETIFLAVSTVLAFTLPLIQLGRGADRWMWLDPSDAPVLLLGPLGLFGISWMLVGATLLRKNWGSQSTNLVKQ